VLCGNQFSLEMLAITEELMTSFGFNVCRMCLSPDKDNSFPSAFDGETEKQFLSLLDVSVSFVIIVPACLC